MLEPELPSAVERDRIGKGGRRRTLFSSESIRATKQMEIWIRWHEISDFNGSYPHSRHYTLDHGTGELAFGDGTLGLVPPLGINNIVANYRVGAGSDGNVAKEPSRNLSLQCRVSPQSPIGSTPRAEPDLETRGESPDNVGPKHCGTEGAPSAAPISNGWHARQRERGSHASSACRT